MDKKLTKSLETYLLAIDSLLEADKAVIVKDVSEFMKVGGASAADGIKKLREKGFINYEPYGNITLTPLGEKAAAAKKYRHKVISEFLNQVLDIELKNAEKNADAIEYSIEDDVLAKFVYFLDFMKQCSCSEPKWMKSCKAALESGEVSEKCRVCTGKCSCAGR